MRHRASRPSETNFAVDGLAGNHDDLEVVLQLVLIESVRFAEEAAGAIARDGIADFAAGHNPGRARLVRRVEHVGDHQAAIIPAPLVVDAPKLAVVLQALAFRK